MPQIVPDTFSDQANWPFAFDWQDDRLAKEKITTDHPSFRGKCPKKGPHKCSTRETRGDEAKIEVEQHLRDAISAGLAVPGRRADAHSRLATLLRADPAAQEEHARRALQENPRHAKANFTMACIRGKQRRTAEQEKHLWRTLDDDPVHVSANFNVAMLLGQRGDLQGKREHLEKVLAANANHRKAQANLVKVEREELEMTQAQRAAQIRAGTYRAAQKQAAHIGDPHARSEDPRAGSPRTENIHVTQHVVNNTVQQNVYNVNGV